MRKVTFAVITLCTAVTALAQTPAPKAQDKAPAAEAIVGHYQFQSGLIMSVENTGGALSMKYTGQPAQALSPAANGRFSYAGGQAELSFDLDATGKGKTLHVYFDERTLPAKRISDATAKKASDALELKVKNQTHDPACVTTLKRVIEESRTGKPDYSKMTLATGQATRTQLPMLQQRFQELGALKEVKFTAVGPAGAEQFDVTFEKGSTQWRIQCLPNGYVGNIGFR